MKVAYILFGPGRLLGSFTCQCLLLTFESQIFLFFPQPFPPLGNVELSAYKGSGKA